MNKLIYDARATEVDSLSDNIIAFFESDGALKENAFLSKTFGEIKKLSDEITQSIKKTRAKSTLGVADDERDKKFRALAKIIDGYASSPLSEICEAGCVLKKIFDKYGLKTLGENYLSKGALIESLLLDFQKEKAVAAAEKLLGVKEAVQALRVAEDNFDDERFLYNNAVVKEKSERCATDVKKALVKLVNEKLVSYLNAVSMADEKVFKSFANLVEIEINKVNRAVKSRSVK